MHYIFSKTLHFPTEPHERVKVVADNELAVIQQLKESEGTDIYVCGGGTFASFLFEHELIDEVIIKLNPLVLGSGIPLFGRSQKAAQLQLLASKAYDTGVLLLTYRVVYT